MAGIRRAFTLLPIQPRVIPARAGDINSATSKISCDISKPLGKAYFDTPNQVAVAISTLTRKLSTAANANIPSTIAHVRSSETLRSEVLYNSVASKRKFHASAASQTLTGSSEYRPNQQQLNYTYSNSPSGSSIWSAILAFFRYRIGRLYYAFYYAQYTTKYVLVFVFPALIFATRFKADTQLSYRIYLENPPDASAGSPTHFQSTLSNVEPVKGATNSTVENSTVNTDATCTDLKALTHPKPQNFLQKFTNFKSGSKVYVDDDMATVKDIKLKLYGSDGEYPEGLLAACHGRILDDEDILALAVRAYCKRDPKIFMWKRNI